MGRPTSRTLRAQVRAAIAVIVVVAVLLFGIPLAVAMDRLIGSRALAGLQRDATRGVAAVPDNVLEAGSTLPAPTASPGTIIGVYDPTGRLVAGNGPLRSALAARASDGREHDGTDQGALSVVLPVLSDRAVAGSVRAAIPAAVLRRRTLEAWGLLAALAAAVVAIALGLAGRAARRISEPFEQLTAAARAVEAGQYDVRLPTWGIAEADAAGEALHDSAQSVEQLIRQEREFVRDASHQLRTPLAGLMLSLDREPPDVDSALERAHHLETTIQDLLALRALSGSDRCDPAEVAAASAGRWTTSARPVQLRSDLAETAAISEPALRQALDVLLDNAVRHGAGVITVTVEPLGELVVVEVADQGEGFGATSAPGTGLRLAASLVERVGGSLVVRRRAPHARVAVLLPSANRSAEQAAAQP